MPIDYTINLKRAGGELAEGKLVLIKLDTTRYVKGGFAYATAIGRVLEWSNGKAVIDVEGKGPINAAMPRSDQSGLGIGYPNRELELLAVNTLRTEDQTAAFHYLDSIAMSSSNHPVAFHVTSVGPDGEIRGHLIGETSERDDPPSGDQLRVIDGVDTEDPLPLGLEAIGQAYVSRELDCLVNGNGALLGAPTVELTVRDGDILVARNFAIEIIDGADTARLVNVNVVGNVEDTAAAVTFLGLDTARPDKHWQAPSLASPGEIIHIHDIGVASTEPDKALVVFFNDPLGKRSMSVLGASGYHAFVNEDLQVYLEGAELQPGLWTMHNLRNVSHTDHEGNWDADVEGDWLPATRADIAELFGDIEALDAELASIMEIDRVEGMGESLIEAANVALFEENFADEHRKFAEKRFGFVDESHWTAYQVANPVDIEAYASAPFGDITDQRVRDVATRMFVRDIRSRSSQFVRIVPTEAERAELAKETNWGNRPPLLFMPNDALDADLEVFAATVHANAERIGKNLDNGRNLGAMSIHRMTSKLSPGTLTADGFPVFSESRHVDGKWHFVGREKKWITLALFSGGSHVATLKTDMHRHILTNAEGFNITTPYRDYHDTAVRIAVSDIVMAADRAVCEIEARHWRDHDYDDFCSPARDGVHKLARSVAYIADGVLHREDGPALQQGPFFSEDSPMMEHRFRGNLHRTDGPAAYQGEHAVWYRHGLEHRTDGPSTDLGDGHVEYRQFDRLNREDGPAVVGPDSQSWYRDDRLHREEGPAIVNRSGETWHRHGRQHRDDGPAVSLFDGSEMYCVNGVVHNESGPAIISRDGERTYAINGVEMDEDEFRSLAGGHAPSAALTP